ncbi:hypothetical protein Tco_1332200, partial [Tanacetum coccineum]
MKSLLKKLNIKPNQSSSDNTSQSNEVNKSLSGITGWFHSVTNKKSTKSSSPSSNMKNIQGFDSVSSSQLDAAMDELRAGLSGADSRDPHVEEEFQIQLALELSAKEDPEAVQIEAVKQISLQSCDPVNTPAEIVAYRYW